MIHNFKLLLKILNLLIYMFHLFFSKLNLNISQLSLTILQTSISVKILLPSSRFFRLFFLQISISIDILFTMLRFRYLLTNRLFLLFSQLDTFHDLTSLRKNIISLTLRSFCKNLSRTIILF